MEKRVSAKKKTILLVFFMACLMFASSMLASLQQARHSVPVLSGSKGVESTDASGNDTYSMTDELNTNLAYNGAVSLQPDDKIRVMVLVDETSLTKTFIERAQNTYETVGQYAASDAGRTEALNMKTRQDLLKQKIDQSFDVEFFYSYTTVINGFSAEIRYGDLDALEELKGVSDVIISNQYEKPETYALTTTANPDVAENYVNIDPSTGIYDTSGSGKTGEGTVIAILDTGLDYTHPAFTKALDNPQNAKFTKDSLNELIKGKNFSAATYTEHLSADDVYVSDRVPYGYDYADKDPEVFPKEVHGTHVAGIVAGNDDVITGAAPQAQLAIMKVFSDLTPGAEQDVILAALEDCVNLEVDVINMSLGSDCGFTREKDSQATNAIYDTILNAGINLVVAASNASSTGMSSHYGLNLTSNPDSGTVGSPSTYKAALSVASISGKKTRYILAENNPIYFTNMTDNNAEELDFVELLLGKEGEPGSVDSKEFDFVVVPGLGQPVDYLGIDVKDKIALIKRGDTTFQDKIKNAQNEGAAGALIYNHLPGTIRMTVGKEKLIPGASIKLEMGNKLLEIAEKNFSLGKGRAGKFTLARDYVAGPFMSDFSSWGPAPDLELKPEITAHGGDIYSAMIGNAYMYNSGTSMASPNLAGVVSLLRQHIYGDAVRYFGSEFSSWTPTKQSNEVRTLVNRLLMSTATIAVAETKNPYSPRKQGAGLADLMSSIETNAYLYVDGSDKTKLSLGHDVEKKGVYELEFNVKNISSMSLGFTISADTMTETFSTAGLAPTVDEAAYMLNDSKLSVSVLSGAGTYNNSNKRLTVEANSDVKIKVTVTLTEADKKYISTNFENGMYVEGFVKLRSTAANGVNLNIPWLAFFGDWTAAPIFDELLWDVSRDEFDGGLNETQKLKPAIQSVMSWAKWIDSTSSSVGEYVYPMGQFLYYVPTGYTGIPADNDKNAMSLNEYGMHELYSISGFLRGAKNIDLKITNAYTGQVMVNKTYQNARKARGNGTGGLTFDEEIDIRKFVSDSGIKFQEGNKYTVTAKARIDYLDGEIAQNNTNDTYEFSFYVDSTAPSIEDMTIREERDRLNNSIIKRYLDMQVFDNHYTQGLALRIYNPDSGEYDSVFDKGLMPVNSQRNSTTKVSVDITNFWERLKDGGYQVYIGLTDYANNFFQQYMDISDIYANIEKIEFTQESRNIDIYQTVDLKTYIDASSLMSNKDNTYYDKETGNMVSGTKTPWIEDYIWDSDNPDVARAYDGRVTGYSEGVAKITIKSKKYQQYDSVGNPLPYPAEAPQASITINVSGKNYGTSVNVPLTGAKLSRNNLQLGKGAEYELRAEIQPLNTTEDFYFVWKTTNANNVKFLLNGVQVDEVSGSPTDIMSKVTIVAVREERDATIRARIMVKDPETGEYKESPFYFGQCVVTVPELYTVEYGALTTYTGSEKIVRIPADLGIKTINQGVFYKNKYVEEVYIPEGVEVIERVAFAYCSKLKLVELPSTLLSIGEAAFIGDIKDNYLVGQLETVTIKKNSNNEYLLRSIGPQAFANCWKIKSIDLSQVISIGDLAFMQNVYLTSLNLSNAKYIGAAAFAFCVNVSSIQFSKDTVLGGSAFEGCISLSNLTLPMSRIGDGAFANCYRLEDGMEHGLKTVRFTSTDPVTIGNNAFAGNKLLSSVTFNGLVSRIGDKAFSDCVAIRTFTLPDGLEALGEQVFLNCTKLESIEIAPLAKLTSLKGSLFEGCDNLTSITVHANNQLLVAEDGIVYTKATSGNPKQSIVLIAPKVNLGNRTLPANVDTIAPYAFAGNLTLTSITMPGVETIGEGAFYGCTNLTTVNIPASVTELSNNAFYGCSKLTAVNFEGENISKIGQYTFAECSSLVSIDIPGNVASVGKGAFSGCSSLTTFSAQQITEISDNAFENCSVLIDIDLSKVTYIGNSAFSGCIMIDEVDLSKVTEFGSYAFADCISLSLTKLDSAKIIGDYAFARASAITSIELPEATHIGAYAFSGYPLKDEEAQRVEPYLENVTLTKAEFIGEGAFRNSKMTTVTLPATLKLVNPFAFAQGVNLTAVNVAAGNAIYFSEDGILYKNVDSGYELVIYPTQKTGETYTIKDGTRRLDSGSMMDNENIVTLNMPHSLRAIGNYALFGCGSLKHINFKSYFAPSFETEITYEVLRTYDVDGSYTAMMVTYHDYSNIVYKYIDLYEGRVESELTMSFPQNGVGYESQMYNNYFDFMKNEKTGTVMNDLAEEVKAMIDALPDLADITLDHKDQVYDARDAYNGLSTEQKGFITEDTKARLDAAVARIEELDKVTDPGTEGCGCGTVVPTGKGNFGFWLGGGLGLISLMFLFVLLMRRNRAAKKQQ